MDVSSVIVMMQRPGVVSNAIYRGDLVFSGEGPALVLEWSGVRGLSEPSITIPLNATKLGPARASEGADYLYPEPVTDPRPAAY